MCVFFPLLFISTEEDWEEQHEKLAEMMEEKPKDDSKVVYVLEDDEECAYPGPTPMHHLRQARINNLGNVEFDPDNEDDAADVAASVSQLILDDEDIESFISRPIPYNTKSIGSKVDT